MKSTICVVGTGYVGMASAIGLAELGHTVRGYDISEERVQLLQNGITPYREAGIEEPLARHLSTGRLSFYRRLEDAAQNADFIIICVGTPARADDSCDLSHLYDASQQVRRVASSRAIVVLRSTVPPGTTSELQASMHPLRVIYAPEFLREGSALTDFLNPDRIVVGADSETDAERYLSLFFALTKPSIVTDSTNAELIKGCSNAFLALKVTFANQVANLCDSIGANALEVLRGVGADKRIGSRFLEPGIGFGGPCFEKDVKSLNHITSKLGTGNELFAATLRINNRQPARIIDALEQEVGALEGRTIGIWGLAFKAGTDDVRDSMAMRIVETLVDRKVNVRVFDPSVDAQYAPKGAVVAESALDAARADALLILTEWPEFKGVDLHQLGSRLSTRVIVDGRNILDADAAMSAGLRYRGVGRKIATDRVSQPLLAAAS